MPALLKRWLDSIVHPTADPAIDSAVAAQRARLPTLWLLGKSGAGKSSIVQRLTGDSEAEIGNGFAPCTRTAQVYEHPQGFPVMRFMDTRGLGDPDYDPTEDLAECQTTSHAVLLVMRVDDPDQADVLRALNHLGRSARRLPMLLVHTALHTVDDASRERVQRHNRAAVAAQIGRQPPEVAVDFRDWHGVTANGDEGLAELCDALIEMVPALADVLQRGSDGDDEHRLFLRQRNFVLGYASAASIADTVPAMGAIVVPSLQGSMLYGLARRYGLDWNARNTRDFLAALGSTFLYRYALTFAGRQLGKLIPGVGQTVGAAVAAGASFASTYALGRAAGLYMYRRCVAQPVARDELRQAFMRAFEQHRHAAKRDDSHTVDVDRTP